MIVVITSANLYPSRRRKKSAAQNVEVVSASALPDFLISRRENVTVLPHAVKAIHPAAVVEGAAVRAAAAVKALTLC